MLATSPDRALVPRRANVPRCQGTAADTAGDSCEAHPQPEDSMTLSRRTLLKIGVGTGAVPLLNSIPFVRANAQPSRRSSGTRADTATLRARPLPLPDVRLTGGPLRHAQELDIKYLLALEPDRMLAYYRQTAGLEPKAKPYGGWDGGGRNLTGHIAGHYLSAVSLMYAATGDDRFKQRASYIVDELKVVQDKNGDGYLSALEGGRKCFDALARGEIKAAAFDLNGEWSPWYTLHKTFAGLRDAYRHTGNRTALEVETKFAAWAEGILSKLDATQIQHMLDTEYGGMNEVLVDLYHDTGDERWLKLSYDFEQTAFIEPLERHQDNLAGKHANTQIPKLIGSVSRYMYTGEPADLIAASYFWDIVARNHSFSTGGDGTDEYFGPPDMLGARVDGRTAESCNVYNMLKLSRQLFSIVPNAHYGDFQERAMYNHALASINREDGRMCYMVPVGRGVTHEYQNMFQSFTCCVGTGMENHALHGDGMYYESGDRLWVSQYAPSTAKWSSAGVEITSETNFPEGESVKLAFTLRSPKEFTLSLRRPYWTTDGFSVKVNGRAVEFPDEGTKLSTGRGERRQKMYAPPTPVGDFVDVKRTWRSGDVVEVVLPKSLRLEPTPDQPNRTAIMWGPLVLAAELGPEPPRRRDIDGPLDNPTVAPVLVFDEPVEMWLEPVAGEPGRFRAKGVGREPTPEGKMRDVELIPFYKVGASTYAVYWDTYTSEAWERKKAEYKAEAEHRQMLEAASVDFVQPGRRSKEEAFNYQHGDGTSTQWNMGRTARASRSWFSYDLAVDPSHPLAVVTTYYTADRRTLPASFEILVDGEKVADEHVERSDPGRFIDATHAIPASVVKGKKRVTVRFQAKEGSQVGAVYGVRIVRSDELK